MAHDTGDRSPGQGRYAAVEREQRWLLDRLPSGLERPSRIIDHYLEGTRLRLRRVEIGSVTTYKLGQKVRVSEDSPEVVKLTTMYLSADEYAALARLPAAELRKTRYMMHRAGHRFSIDRFYGHLEGLLLAEIELAVGQPLLPDPPEARLDVTRDDRFSGGTLAGMTADDLAALLAAT
ncbi:MAG TPA: hypothetical protein VM030_05395 [Acidimicrobiales bacterium]|nr:hypothetical protein [Acidimicrobiales bacterium]